MTESKALSLSSFIKEEEDRLKRFEAWYRKMHLGSPLDYPMEFDEDNSGMWSEMLDLFDFNES